MPLPEHLFPHGLNMKITWRFFFFFKMEEQAPPPNYYIRSSGGARILKFKKFPGDSDKGPGMGTFPAQKLNFVTSESPQQNLLQAGNSRGICCWVHSKVWARTLLTAPTGASERPVKCMHLILNNNNIIIILVSLSILPLDPNPMDLKQIHEVSTMC